MCCLPSASWQAPESLTPSSKEPERVLPKGCSGTILSFQNFISLPFLTSSMIALKKMFFYRHHAFPKGGWRCRIRGGSDHHPDRGLELWKTSVAHFCPGSWNNLYHHLRSKALLKSQRVMTPKPTNSLCLQTSFQLTREKTVMSSCTPLQRNIFLRESMSLFTHLRSGKKERE